MAKQKSVRKRKPQQKIIIPDCKNFSGYKPCYPGTTCYAGCVDHEKASKKILIVNLDAMGAVVQTTAMLPAIKRKYPHSHISWITLKNSYRLLDNNPYLDAVYVWEPESWMILQEMKFDVVFSVDKTKRSCAFVNTLTAKEKIGFGMNERGQIIPLNKESQYFYLMGLDDELKFKKNTKPGTHILQEAMKLSYKRDEYVLHLSEEEKSYCEWYKNEHRISTTDLVVGFNTGCSNLYPNKKMTIDQHVYLINKLHDAAGIRLVLLGGPEDTERNADIAMRVEDKVLNTPTTEGVRRGICYENICDIIITGDSFGMHVGIGLKKYVIAWFGLSCWNEIDLYDRGFKLIPHGLHCAPCWKKECPYNLECIQMIDLDKIVAEVKRWGGIRSDVFMQGVR